MADAYPLLSTYDRLTAALVDTVNAALEQYRRDRGPDGPSLAKVRTTWRPVPDQLDGIDEARATLAEDILAVATNGDLTQDARDRQIETLADVAWVRIKTAVADIHTRAQTMLDATRAAIYPARPEPADAAQEARLAGLKTDLRMSLDPVDDDNRVVDIIKARLARALTSRDDLAAWLLACSDWPADYLCARDFDHQLPALAAAVDSAVAESTPDAEPGVSLYRTLAHPREGLPLLDTLLGGVLTQVFDEVKAWRPTSGAPVPPSRLNGAGSGTQPNNERPEAMTF